MKNNDKVEFYNGKNLVAAVNSSMVPPIGSYISIRKKTWEIVAVSFAVDHADERAECGMRCNVDVQAT